MEKNSSSPLKMKTTDAYPEHEYSIIQLQNTSVSMFLSTLIHPVFGNAISGVLLCSLSSAVRHSHSYTPGFVQQLLCCSWRWNTLLKGTLWKVKKEADKTALTAFVYLILNRHIALTLFFKSIYFLVDDTIVMNRLNPAPTCASLLQFRHTEAVGRKQFV